MSHERSKVIHLFSYFWHKSVFSLKLSFFQKDNDYDGIEGYEHVNSEDMKCQKRDSGVDLCDKVEKTTQNAKIKNRKSKFSDQSCKGNDINFKSGMIFDLEM